MVPLGVGGTHTIGNVRIICRTCNLRRPKDGSDFDGQPTLWAQDPAAVPRRTKPPRSSSLPSRPRCSCGETLWRGRCRACHPLRRPRYVPAAQLTSAEQAERAHLAARMRAEGRSWWEIADTLGYGRESSAFLAVQRSLATQSDAVSMHEHTA
jgi:hypothetical protein